MPDTWKNIATRVPLVDANSAADANDIMADIRLLKGGVAGTAPTTTIEDLSTNKMSQPAGISFFISGAQTASTTVAKVFMRLPKALTLDATTPVLISLVTGNTGAAFIVDVHYIAYANTTTQPAPTTIFTTGPGTNRPSIADGAYSASSGASDVTSLAAGGFVAIYVDQVGSTIAGSDLMVTLKSA